MNKIDKQFERIKTIFSAEEIPPVTGETLHRYFEYLREKLVCPCMLTGIESMGYFSWEERFEFGYGGEEEYQLLRQQRGSYHDKYELSTFADAIVDEEWDILVKVHRIPRRKQFTIPLSELQAVDRAARNYQLLNDYSVWYVNWR